MRHDKVEEVARYLVKAQRVKLFFRYLTEEEAKEITVHSDTDFAGCRKTRKSTSGGVLMISSHLIKSWSSTQAVIALLQWRSRILRHGESSCTRHWS